MPRDGYVRAIQVKLRQSVFAFVEHNNNLLSTRTAPIKTTVFASIINMQRQLGIICDAIPATTTEHN